MMLITGVLFATRAIFRNRYLKNHQIDTVIGIDESFTLNIGGIKQYFNVRGESTSNPLILFLHGGPGSPVIPIMHMYQSHWESFATVINWDQRNAGKTYYLNDSAEVYNTLTLNQMIEDVYEVVEAMKERYQQNDLIIIGHSWGSILGTIYAKTYPDTILGYIGIGQMINAAEGDRLAVAEAIIKAQEKGASNDVETLSKLSNYSLADVEFDKKNFHTMRRLTTKYLAPNVRNVSLWQIFISPYYKLADLQFFLLDSFATQKPLLDIIAFDFDARELTTEYEIPIFYICGEQDWYTPTALVSEYYQTIQAPKKGFYVIEKAGHILMVDQATDFAGILREIIEEIK